MGQASQLRMGCYSHEAARDGLGEELAWSTPCVEGGEVCSCLGKDCPFSNCGWLSGQPAPIGR